MATLLIVDDDRNFLLSLAEGLRSCREKFEVLTAENGREAIEILKTHKIELMITDLKMPEVDGFQLLAHMVPHYPQIPVIVMTAFATPEMEDRLMNMRTFMFLEKPLDFNMMVEKVLQGMEAGSHYFTKVLSLCSFLQTLELGKKTCAVSVRSEGRMGVLYFFNGLLIDGETGGVTGAQAVYDIVSWEAAEVEMGVQHREKPRQLDTPLNFIIKEEQRRQTRLMRENGERRDDDTAINIKINLKETTMDMTKLKQAMETLKSDMGDALLSSGIVSRADARLIVHYNAHPKISILYSQFTTYLKRILSDCDMPTIGNYYMINLEGNKSIIALPLRDYEWGIVIDLSKFQLGLFLNVTLPKMLKAFKEAVST
ncbi:MAG: response regulator [bacterium]|nr:response regulator [bacterium]